MSTSESVDPHTIARPQQAQHTNLGRSAVALLLGLSLLILGFAALPHLAAWTQAWGNIPVYLAYFLVMSIAARLFWGGADPFLAATKAVLTGRS